MELKYRLTLKKVSDLITRTISGLETVTDITEALERLSKSKMFNDLANLISKRFVTLANTLDAKTWRDAARANSKGNVIFRALQATLRTNIGLAVNDKFLENATLIRTLPLKVSEEVTKFVATETYKGLRAEEIAKTLQVKVAGYSNARASLIARTESSKAMTALTEARAKDVGVNWYRWSTAQDGNRVRESHQHMQGVLVRWNDPPSPERLVNEKDVGNYNAGNIYNCRCFPRPIINLNNVTWPSKVYYHGSIQMMTRKQFEQIK